MREELASYAHTAWSEYMTYFLDKLEVNADGDLVVPAGYAAALRRQIQTDYKDLTQEEKDYDRDEADKMISIISRVVVANPNLLTALEEVIQNPTIRRLAAERGTIFSMWDRSRHAVIKATGRDANWGIEEDGTTP